MTPAPDRVTAYTSLDCTSSNAAPGVDTVLAVLNAAGTIYEANAGYTTGYIIAGVAWTAVETAAAIYGFNTSGSCREARERRDLLLEQQQTQQQRWYPQPPQQPYYPPPPGYNPPPPAAPRPQQPAPPPPQPSPQSVPSSTFY